MSLALPFNEKGMVLCPRSYVCFLSYLSLPEGRLDQAALLIQAHVMRVLVAADICIGKVAHGMNQGWPPDPILQDKVATFTQQVLCCGENLRTKILGDMVDNVIDDDKIKLPFGFPSQFLCRDLAKRDIPGRMLEEPT